MRARRLGLEQSPVMLASETNLRDILTTLEAEDPDLAIIDSIQTMWADNVDSAPGSVSQVRASAHELTTFAKRREISVVMVGHVTKEGAIAGPRVVEHMVDTVLYFEGERGHGRLAMILAVLESRCGVPFTGLDVYLNVAGGLRITEPAADLAVAAALVSAREDAALPAEAVVFGEISLSGALRPVVQTENRLKEAQKLGFTSAITPQQAKQVAASGLTLQQPQDLAGFVQDIFGDR